MYLLENYARKFENMQEYSITRYFVSLYPAPSLPLLLSSVSLLAFHYHTNLFYKIWLD